MIRTGQLEERLLDTMLEEVEGHGPDVEWITQIAASTRASIREPEVEPEHPSRALLVAAVLAAGILTVLVIWARTGDDAAPVDRVGATEVSQEPPPEQDPDSRSPEDWIEALEDESQVRAGVRALARGGPPALRAMIAALDDEEAPRARVLEALHAMGEDAAGALPSITRLMREVQKDDPLLRAIVRTAATVAPFGSEEQRRDVRRTVLLEIYVNTGGQMGRPTPPEFSPRDVARLLHRLEIPLDANANDLIACMTDPSPFVRELAAYRLREHDGADVRTALHQAIVGDHPTRIAVSWRLEGGHSGAFRCAEECDDIIGYAAARSLAAIAPERPIAVRAHMDIIRMGARSEQRRSAFSLARIQIDAGDVDDVTAALATWLTHDDPEFLREMVVVAGRLPSLTAAARRELERLATHVDRRIAAGAELALRARR